jgi:alkylmercury lyase
MSDDEPDIHELADKLTAAMPRLDPREQQVALALIRQLALAAPVSGNLLAEEAELPEADVANALERLPGVFRDDEQRVVGFMGLTIVEMGHHRIHLDGFTLSAWCAWDTLFLPELLGASARVVSRAPTGEEAISLTVTPDGLTEVRPPDTVVSFLVPKTGFNADIIQSFCHFVHFFASFEAGATWTAEHPGTFLLSVDDAYRLGQLTNQAIFGAALTGGRR